MLITYEHGLCEHVVRMRYSSQYLVSLRFADELKENGIIATCFCTVYIFTVRSTEHKW